MAENTESPEEKKINEAQKAIMKILEGFSAQASKIILGGVNDTIDSYSIFKAPNFKEKSS